ncbi:MAG: DUF2459 domain-containing protein [Pikeienuella sp.]
MPSRTGRRRLRRLCRPLIGALLLLTLTIAGLAPHDPARAWRAEGAEPGRLIRVIDHGFHTGLVIGTADLRAAAVHLGRDAPEIAARLRQLAALWPTAVSLEIGWGDAAFYMATPGLVDVQSGLALRALLWPTASAIHVVPVWVPPGRAFPQVAHIDLRLSDAAAARLAARLSDTLIADPVHRFERLAPSLYGSGAFFPAEPSYHAFFTCNHWTSSLLRAAGAPSSWIFSATSAGLMAELHWRL